DRERAEPAVAIAAALDVADAGVTLGGGLDVLGAIVDEAHRPAALLREERGVERDDRGVLLLAAEAAAGHRLGDVDPLRGELERLEEGLVDVERALDRAGRVGSLVIPPRDHALGLDVELLLVAGRVAPLDDDIARGDGLLDRALALRGPRLGGRYL